MKKIHCFASLALIVGGYSLLVRFAPPVVVSKFANELRRQGYEIRYEESYVGSFPGSMSWRYTDTVVTFPPSRFGRFSLTIPDITLVSGGWNPLHFYLDAAGEVKGLNGENDTPLFQANIKQFNLDGNLTLRNRVDDLLLQLLVDDVVIADTLSLPLGNTIKWVSVGAHTVTGHSDLLSDHNDMTLMMDVGVDYGPISSQMTGVASLDESMQLAFAMKSKTKGLHEAADVLVERGFYSSLNRTELKQLLNCIRVMDENSEALWDVDITLRNRVLSMGELRVAKL